MRLYRTMASEEVDIRNEVFLRCVVTVRCVALNEQRYVHMSLCSPSLRNHVIHVRGETLMVNANNACDRVPAQLPTLGQRLAATATEPPQRQPPFYQLLGFLTLPPLQQSQTGRRFPFHYY